jgi:hypothetical protein
MSSINLEPPFEKIDASKLYVCEIDGVLGMSVENWILVCKKRIIKLFKNEKAIDKTRNRTLYVSFLFDEVSSMPIVFKADFLSFLAKNRIDLEVDLAVDREGKESA